MSRTSSVPPGEARSARAALALGLAVVLAAVTLGVPSMARADGVYKCQGTRQPSGPAQFGSCNGNVPAQLLWGSFGGLFKLFQLPLQGLALHSAETVASQGESMVLDWLWGKHTLFFVPSGPGLPCSFDPPGENRFVGDKFSFDGLMDFPLPFPVTAGIVPNSRYIGPTDKSKSVLFGGPEALTQGGNLANPGALVAAGVVGATAKVRVAVGGCCLPLPVNKALVSINGQIYELPKPPHQFATVYEIEVPIDQIRFPEPATNGFCPWPAMNLIIVAHPYINTVMDWAEITISSSPPYVLVPGTQTMNPANTVSAFTCEAAKAYKALAGISPLISTPIDAAGSLSGGFDLCALNAKSTWSEFLSIMKADNTPVKTTDDMLQLPSLLNASGGFPMPGNFFLPVPPAEYYLSGAAKSMGVGSIRVIAHSKGGVDMLQYLTSNSYQSTYEGRGLQVTGVATLSSPYGGSALASDWLRGQTKAPTNLTDLIAEKQLGDLANNLDYLVAQLNNLLTLGWGWPAAFITAEQDPARARRLSAEAMDRGLKGNHPRFITFGANADSSADDKVRLDCSGTKSLAGIAEIPDCHPIDDDVPGGDFAAIMKEPGYTIIGYGNCLGYNSGGECAGGWGGFVHNDTVVDVFSAALPNAQSKHHVLDLFPGHGHWGGVAGSSISSNADHSTILRERAETVWPYIKSGLQSPLKTTY